ncbi:DUF488 family protein [Neisseriaceae bacterium ESL0693]|nr:DUF488 family protein [Neisseriaceae bacterium ESL0693]
MYQVQRVYDYHGDEKTAQAAVLVDRLWPRGISKVRLAGVRWCKNVTPSTALRQWFHQNPQARYAEFCRLYHKELQQPEKQAALHALRQQEKEHGHLLLLTAVKNVDHSHIPVLLSALKES